MVRGVESLGNVALDQDVRNQRQALEGKCQYKKVRTCSGREEARPVRPCRLDAGTRLDGRGALSPHEWPKGVDLARCTFRIDADALPGIFIV
jgi:hypothetical protein